MSLTTYLNTLVGIEANRDHSDANVPMTFTTYLQTLVGTEAERDENTSLVTYLQNLVGKKAERDDTKSLITYLNTVIGLEDEQDVGKSLVAYLNKIVGIEIEQDYRPPIYKIAGSLFTFTTGSNIVVCSNLASYNAATVGWWIFAEGDVVASAAQVVSKTHSGYILTLDRVYEGIIETEDIVGYYYTPPIYKIAHAGSSNALFTFTAGSNTVVCSNLASYNAVIEGWWIFADGDSVTVAAKVVSKTLSGYVLNLDRNYEGIVETTGVGYYCIQYSGTIVSGQIATPAIGTLHTEDFSFTNIERHIHGRHLHTTDPESHSGGGDSPLDRYVTYIMEWASTLDLDGNGLIYGQPGAEGLIPVPPPPFPPMLKNIPPE